MLNPTVRKILSLLTLSLISCIAAGTSLVFAKEVTLVGKEGWPSFEKENNITTQKGRFGYDCIQIASNSFDSDEYTDVLINFEDSENVIAAGDYELIQNNLIFLQQLRLQK